MKSLQHTLRILGVATGLALCAAPAMAQDAQVQSVQVVPGDSTQVVLTLNSSSAGTAVSAFKMSDPDRVIIDIADASVAGDLGTIAGAGDLVDRVEAESFDDGQGLITRVRVYLTGDADHKVVSEGSTIRLSLTPAAAAADPLGDALAGAQPTSGSTSGPAYTVPGQYTQASDSAGGLPSGPCLSGSGCNEGALPGGARLRSLDFNHDDDTSRVIIGTHSTSNYTANQPSPNLIVVDLPGAFVPESLRRVVDTSQFYSPVSSVRAYPTSSGTRVAINLRQSTDYSVRLDDGAIVVDVAVPTNMKQAALSGQQSFSEVSPAGPGDESIKGAYAEELYIGTGGATAAPQSAFNQGVGVSDPSSQLGSAAGFMVDQSVGTGVVYTGRKISLDFVNADIHSIFRLISNVSNLNIVTGDDVKGNVTVRLVDVPWDQALAAILQAKGLGSQRFGNIVRVAPLETIKAEQQAKLESKRAVEDLKDINMMVLPVDFGDAADLSKRIKSILSTKGSVDVDSRTNQIIVRETDDRLAQIRELIRQLDKDTPQVLIEARIVEASSNFTTGLGIEWGGTLDASAATGYSTGLFFPNSIGANGGIAPGGEGDAVYFDQGDGALMVDLGADGPTGAMNLSLGSIPGLFDLDARLSAVEQEGSGKVVSAPRVTTLDNVTATITQGAQIPYASTSAGGTQVQFINAALSLEVTPHITSDGRVFLQVAVENNRADFSNTIQGRPAILIKEAQTEVLVDSGDTTVIGGVYSVSDSEQQNRVPGLSKIPLLGYLFKNSSRNRSRDELLVFITPHIVSAGE